MIFLLLLITFYYANTTHNVISNNICINLIISYFGQYKSIKAGGVFLC